MCHGGYIPIGFVGTKAGIKGASVVMGYLETGMRVLDNLSTSGSFTRACSFGRTTQHGG